MASITELPRGALGRAMVMAAHNLVSPRRHIDVAACCRKTIHAGARLARNRQARALRAARGFNGGALKRPAVGWRRRKKWREACLSINTKIATSDGRHQAASIVSRHLSIHGEYCAY